MLTGIATRARRIAIPVAIALSAVTFAAPRAQATSPAHMYLTTSRVISGIGFPTSISQPNDGSGRIFVTEKSGRIIVRLPSGSLHTFLDLRSRVSDDGERGLLGLTFSPQYATNGFFFVFYTDLSHYVHISRFHATPSSNTADTSERTLIRIAHNTYSNHNGGQIEIGPDGYLYAGIGDGGGAQGPGGWSQNLGLLLGKVIRIDAMHTCGSLNYCIPSGNPFAGSSSRRKEIWHYGFRNPWRFSFDPSTKYLWIADVGEKAREEFDVSGSTTPGRNYGWDCREGSLNTASSYGGSYCYDGRTFYSPMWEYSHSSGRCAIIGGYVYRGETYKTLMGGIYLWGDYCTGEVWGFYRQSDGTKRVAKVYDHSQQITSFGRIANGEIYMADAGGNVYHLVPHAR